MTPERLKEIKARCGKAIHGPWQVHNDGPMPACNSIHTAWDHGQLGGPAPVVTMCYGIDLDNENAPYQAVAISPDVADFIAHSRQDVDDLVDEVERLEEENRILRLCTDAELPNAAIHQVREVLKAGGFEAAFIDDAAMLAVRRVKRLEAEVADKEREIECLKALMAATPSDPIPVTLTVTSLTNEGGINDKA